MPQVLPVKFRLRLFQMVAIVSSTLQVLLDYDLPIRPSSLSAYACFAAQWRIYFEFGVVASPQHSMELFRHLIKGTLARLDLLLPLLLESSRGCVARGI
jgi:hypothetical protein